MLPSFCKQEIVRRRASTREERGSTITDWSNFTDLIISDISVQPSSGYIDTDGRVLGISDTYTVYVNPDDDVVAGDKILFEGKIYFVEKEPQTWISPTGRVSNKTFTMTLHAG